MRPIDAPLGAKYTDHKLYFTYIRPATFLPFKEEEYVATETQLIQLPSTAPIHRAASLSGMGAISESERRRMYEQTRQTMQHVKEQEKERFKQIGKQQREMAKPIELSDKMKKKIAEEMKYRR